jgi:hypothetical protein
MLDERWRTNNRHAAVPQYTFAHLLNRGTAIQATLTCVAKHAFLSQLRTGTGLHTRSGRVNCRLKVRLAAVHTRFAPPLLAAVRLFSSGHQALECAIPSTHDAK